MPGKTILLIVSIATVSIVLAGCGGGGGSSIVPSSATGTGSVLVRVDFSSTKNRTIPTGTNTVFVTVTGNDLTAALNAVLTPSSPSATFTQVPVGSKIVRADAFDGAAPSPLPSGTTSFGNLLASGFTEVTVTKDSTASADITVNSLSTDAIQFTGTQTLNGVTVTTQQDSKGNQRFFSEDSQGLKFHGLQINAPAALSLSGKSLRSTGRQTTSTGTQLLFDPPIVIPDGLTAGQTFPQTSNVFVDGFAQGQVSVTVKSHGEEGVMVPGGDFEGDVPHVSITYMAASTSTSPTSPPFASIFKVQRQDYWFASGLGPVMRRDQFFDTTLPSRLSIYTGSTPARLANASRGLRGFFATSFFPMTPGTVLNYANLN